MYGYQNPFAGLRQQLEKQLQELDAMEQQTMRPRQPIGVDPHMQSVVRQEVDRYMNERQQQGAQAQPGNPMAQITGAIEAVLSGDDVKFLADNVGILPDYLRSAEGKSLLEKMVKGMRKHGENAVATQSGAASG